MWRHGPVSFAREQAVKEGWKESFRREEDGTGSFLLQREMHEHPERYFFLTIQGVQDVPPPKPLPDQLDGAFANVGVLRREFTLPFLDATLRAALHKADGGAWRLDASSPQRFVVDGAPDAAAAQQRCALALEALHLLGEICTPAQTFVNGRFARFGGPTRTAAEDARVRSLCARCDALGARPVAEWLEERRSRAAFEVELLVARQDGWLSEQLLAPKGYSRSEHAVLPLRPSLLPDELLVWHLCAQPRGLVSAWTQRCFPLFDSALVREYLKVMRGNAELAVEEKPLDNPSVWTLPLRWREAREGGVFSTWKLCELWNLTDDQLCQLAQPCALAILRTALIVLRESFGGTLQPRELQWQPAKPRRAASPTLFDAPRFAALRDDGKSLNAQGGGADERDHFVAVTAEQEFDARELLDDRALGICAKIKMERPTSESVKIFAHIRKCVRKAPQQDQFHTTTDVFACALDEILKGVPPKCRAAVRAATQPSLQEKQLGMLRAVYRGFLALFLREIRSNDRILYGVCLPMPSGQREPTVLRAQDHIRTLAGAADQAELDRELAADREVAAATAAAEREAAAAKARAREAAEAAEARAREAAEPSETPTSDSDGVEDSSPAHSPCASSGEDPSDSDEDE